LEDGERVVEDVMGILLVVVEEDRVTDLVLLNFTSEFTGYL
jgi:predicted RNA-binding protein